MSVLPLRTLCLRVRTSSPAFPNCRLSAVGCELPLPPSSSPAIFASLVKPKSFVCNAYKKQGVGGEREAGAMSPLSLGTLCLCVRISSLSAPNHRLSAVGCKRPLLPDTFPATLVRPVKPKSIVSDAYKKHGGLGECVARLAPHSPRVTSVTHSDARNSNLFMRLLHDSLDTRGVGGCPPPSPLQLPLSPH